jgi:hypothetical protein
VDQLHARWELGGSACGCLLALCSIVILYAGCHAGAVLALAAEPVVLVLAALCWQSGVVLWSWLPGVGVCWLAAGCKLEWPWLLPGCVMHMGCIGFCEFGMYWVLNTGHMGHWVKGLKGDAELRTCSR